MIAPAPCYYADRMAACGYLSVPENRAAPGRRHIDVQFVLVRAQSPSGIPVFFVAGGPGQSMIAVGRNLMQTQLAQNLRAHHDLVFVDQRGTGASHALGCDLYGPDASSAQIASALFPQEALRVCRARLAAHADLGAYNTNEATDDMNAIRQALGYRRIALWGVSYGSEFCLDYIRRHGQSVARAVLEDVAPPQFAVIPPFAAGGDTAIAYASRSFPRLGDELRRLDRRALRGIGRDVFVNGVLESLTDPRAAGMLSAVVDGAVRGDVQPLALYLADRRRREVQDLDMGMHLSVLCSESVPFIDANTRERLRSTFAGDTVVQAYERACASWNVPHVDPSFASPVASDVPVLMFSGAVDPWTPPYEAAQALRFLPNGKQVIVPDAGHDLDTPAVVERGTAFIDAAS
jgi:pimeloyl-ACP methyl ester carboxylesterase